MMIRIMTKKKKKKKTSNITDSALFALSMYNICWTKVNE